MHKIVIEPVDYNVARDNSK